MLIRCPRLGAHEAVLLTSLVSEKSLLIPVSKPGAQKAALLTNLVSEKFLFFLLSSPLFTTITAHRPRLTGGFDESQIKWLMCQLYVAQFWTHKSYVSPIYATPEFYNRITTKERNNHSRVFFKHKTKINGQDKMSFMKSPSHMDTFCIKNSLTELWNITFKRIMTTFTKNLSRHIVELNLRHYSKLQSAVQ